VSEEIDAVRVEITHCQKVLNGLNGNEGFEILIKDQQSLIRDLDAQWQSLNLTDDKGINRFLEIKYAKLAAQSIVNVLDYYRERLALALESKDEIDNESEYQHGYSE
jgi:hypothetical protein